MLITSSQQKSIDTDRGNRKSGNYYESLDQNIIYTENVANVTNFVGYISGHKPGPHLRSSL